MASAGGAIWFVLNRVAVTQPVTVTGAVLVRNEDANKQTSISGVKVAVGQGTTRRDVLTSAAGYFELTLGKQVTVGQPILLEFRHPEYMPQDLTVFAGDRLVVVRLVPLLDSTPETAVPQPIAVSNVKVRYTVTTSSLFNTGSVAKTFRVPGTGGLPCHHHHPCSPDQKWKATIGTSALEAPRGDIFSNARVSCIAGPCSFTRIRSDGFSRGGPRLTVAIIGWSDSTTFLFEAEVFREMMGSSERVSYPVIFGQTLHFTVPAGAEGACLEADLDHDSIVFPLGPQALLSWAVCAISENADHAKAYQCELKPGYSFK